MIHRRILLPLAAALTTLVLAVVAYYPGLSGSFLFDDYSNLKLLTDVGRLDRIDAVIHYLLSGFAGPTGRPLSMASFLLDAAHWPNDPAAFKRTNLLFHLLNGILLVTLMWALLRTLQMDKRRAAAVAWLGATLWLLHPLWVSTTLYVVQRMTLLAATFVLSGILLYLLGRQRIAAGKGTSGMALIAAGVLGCGLLATLSKENGALLPVLVLVLERYALRLNAPLPVASQRIWRPVWLVCVMLPSAMIAAYLCAQLPPMFRGEMGVRDFTPFDRLLTEGRVLIRYLLSLWIPRPFSGGLYEDDVELSTGPLSPSTTLFAWLTIFGLIVAAERWRRRRPFASIAIMFFLAGHLLESTWLPLELSFEHRNYLPAALMFLPLAAWLIPDNQPKGCKVAAIVCVVLLTALTAVRADLWGRPFLLSLSWARHHPHSIRAQASLADFWRETGNTGEAARLLDNALAKHRRDLLLQINRLAVDCQQGILPVARADAILDTVSHANLRDNVKRQQVIRLLEILRGGQCGNSGIALFLQVIGAAQHPRETTNQWPAELSYQEGLYRLHQGQREQALAAFHNALILAPSNDAILSTAAVLASHALYGDALQVLDTRPGPRISTGFNVGTLRNWWLDSSGYWERERRILRSAIEDDLHTHKTLPAPGK